MMGLVLDAKWDPRPDYPLSGWEQETGKAITGNSVWRYPKLEVRDWPDPKPGPKEVALAVQACGVCGSDMHFYETDEGSYILYPGLTSSPPSWATNSRARWSRSAKRSNCSRSAIW